MGKKVNQSSLKTSKNIEKRQLNSLIKVLKPKVFITDSSSFKRLVQELTGTTSSPISENIPLIEPESSFEDSIDASTDSVEFCNPIPYCEPLPNHHGYGYGHDHISEALYTNQQETLRDMPEGQEDPESSTEGSFDALDFCNQVDFCEELNHGYGQVSVNQQVGLLELESWLLDMDKTPVQDNFFQVPQELNTYHQYAFSGYI